MATATAPTKDDILTLEKSYWDAMKRKDGARTAELSGNPSVVSGIQGVMTIPRDKMSQMTEDGNWTLEDYEFEDVQFTTPTPDVAVIAYKVKQTGTMKGKKMEMRAADLSTWVRGANGWECCAHAETVLDGH